MNVPQSATMMVSDQHRPKGQKETPMTETEFFDKENGTRNALRGPTMSDSDRNIMNDLAGEADEPCVFCDEPVRPNANPAGPYWEFTADKDGEEPCHEECYDDAKEAAEEARAEDYAERRLGAR